MLILSWILFISFVLILIGWAYWIIKSKQHKLASSTIPLFVLAITISFNFILTLNHEKEEEIKKKELKEIQENETRAKVTLLRWELEANSTIIEKLSSSINQELSILKDKSIVISPLPQFKMDMWLMVRGQGALFLNNLNEINTLENAYFIMELANDYIRTRENYRITNEQLPNFLDRMMKFDNGFIEIFFKQVDIRKGILQSKLVLNQILRWDTNDLTNQIIAKYGESGLDLSSNQEKLIHQSEKIIEQLAGWSSTYLEQGAAKH